MSFRCFAERTFSEIETRKDLRGSLLKFGVKFLDDAMRGIQPQDFILIGAMSGAGKTQFCCNMALANLEDGKRVHYIALEADDLEIDRRIKFQILSRIYFADPNRPQIREGLQFDLWYLGFYGEELMKYEVEAAKEAFEKYRNLKLFYKSSKFGIDELIEEVLGCAKETDLIIVDHAHYFDLDEDENENKALKKIAMMCRTLALEQNKPIALVAHLRKKDKFNPELVPGIEEFHGSSDLFKIATKAITFAPGQVTSAGNFETFFRIGKYRLNGGVTRYMGRTIYSAERGTYDSTYRLGWAEQKKRDPTPENPNCYQELAEDDYPKWAARLGPRVGDTSRDASPKPGTDKGKQRAPLPYADS